MSDTSQGAGWWQASDGKWYPPHLHPDTPPPTPPPTVPPPTPTTEVESYWAQASSPEPEHAEPVADRIDQPTAEWSTSATSSPNASLTTTWSTSTPAPFAQPPGLQQPTPHAPLAPPKKSRTGLWIALGVIGVVVLLLAGALVGATLWVRSSSSNLVEAIDELNEQALIDFSDAVEAAGPTNCLVDGIQDDGTGDYEVIAEITNQSGERSDYRIDYELFDSQGESLGTDYGILVGVEAGVSHSESTIGVIDAEVPWQEVQCEVFAAVRRPTS